MSKICIVIPAYEPDDKLVELIEALEGRFPIVVVDDGSADKRAFGPIKDKVTALLAHDRNRGKGAALKTAFSYVLDNLKDVEGVVTADSDGQHTPLDIGRMADLVATGYPGIVLGVRSFVGKVPFRSLLGNFSTRFLFAFMTGLRILDTQTGLRGIPRSLLPRMLQLPGDRYEYEMKMLLDSKNHDKPPKQIDVETIYIAENKSSHFNPIKDSLRVWGALFHFCFSSVGAFALDNACYILALAGLRHSGLTLAASMLLALVLARFISANFQYFYNQRMTFRARAGVGSYMKYWVLAAVILCLSYFFTKVVVGRCGLNSNALITFAKIVVEAILFVMSFVLQRCWVFAK